jgi:hypothetical protein
VFCDQFLCSFASWTIFFCVFGLTIERPMPFVNLTLGFVFGDSIPFLDSANQLVTLSRDHIEIVICQLSPAGFRRAFCLFPFPCYLVLIHNPS